jgi:hypothetical protein
MGADATAGTSAHRTWQRRWRVSVTQIAAALAWDAHALPPLRDPAALISCRTELVAKVLRGAADAIALHVVDIDRRIPAGWPGRASRSPDRRYLRLGPRSFPRGLTRTYERFQRRLRAVVRSCCGCVAASPTQFPCAGSSCSARAPDPCATPRNLGSRRCHRGRRRGPTRRKHAPALRPHEDAAPPSPRPTTTAANRRPLMAHDRRDA